MLVPNKSVGTVSNLINEYQKAEYAKSKGAASL